MFKLEKIFNPWVLLIINVIIIEAAESLGGGKLFYDTGLVHALAILFILLAISRAFRHYYTFDPVLEKFVHSVVAALIIFAASHILEFLSYVVFNLRDDAIFANVINFYLVSMILMTIGAERFLKVIKGRSRLFIGVLIVMIAVFSLLTVLNLVNDQWVSLDPLTPAFDLYAIAVIILGTLGTVWIWKIRRAVPATVGFSNYLIAAMIIIAFAGLQNLSYALFENIGIPSYQSVYLSHFAFYAALSLMFLAFTKLYHMGGVYDQLRDNEDAGKARLK